MAALRRRQTMNVGRTVEVKHAALTLQNNKGFWLLMKHGWKQGQGLGKNQQGRTGNVTVYTYTYIYTSSSTCNCMKNMHSGSQFIEPVNYIMNALNLCLFRLVKY